MYVLEEVVMAQAGSLLAEMGAQMRHEQFWAMFNYTLALGLFSIAIVASVLAHNCWCDRRSPQTFWGWIAILALIPALTLIVDGVFKWEAKANWHWKKEREIKSLIRQLRDQGARPSDISIQLSKLDEMMDSEWPSLGRTFTKVDAK